MVSSSCAPPAASGILVQSLSAATGCEVDLARNNQITESGLDLGCRNRHRSLTHALMIFCSLTRKSPCEVDLARNNQITESGLDLGCRNRHRSLTHALMIFCSLTRKPPCEVFGTHR